MGEDDPRDDTRRAVLEEKARIAADRVREHDQGIQQALELARSMLPQAEESTVVTVLRGNRVWLSDGASHRVVELEPGAPFVLERGPPAAPSPWQRWRSHAAVAAIAFGVALAALTLVPRFLYRDGLVEENVRLRGELHSVEQRVEELDRLLLRLRLYDAQLRSLSEPTGDFGPLPPSVFANHTLILPEQGPLPPLPPRADTLGGRMEQLLARVPGDEGRINDIIAGYQTLHDIDEALPRIWPSVGQLYSGFGLRRSPIEGRWMFHHGLDIGGMANDPIYAAAPGTVIYSGYNSGLGNHLRVDHGFGIVTVYGHCRRLYKRVGDEVNTGDLIARVGKTGRATGNHLHFELRLDGNAVDPFDYFRLPSEELDKAFGDAAGSRR